MDKTVIHKHWDIVSKHYPGMSITQLGMVVLMIGVIRSSMGHEDAVSTIRDYIHKEDLSPEIRQCVDFIEREFISMMKSKIDIDFWKKGNSGEFRRDIDLVRLVNE